jgi:hypothetical protein
MEGSVILGTENYIACNSMSDGITGNIIKGHDVFDISRFMKDTRHMIIFDVLSAESPVGDNGERVRLYLTDIGYKHAVESEMRDEINIIRHARVFSGNLYYNV